MKTAHSYTSHTHTLTCVCSPAGLLNKCIVAGIKRKKLMCVQLMESFNMSNNRGVKQKNMWLMCVQ